MLIEKCALACRVAMWNYFAYRLTQSTFVVFLFNRIMQTYGRNLMVVILIKIAALEYYENRMEFAKFISLDSVARIECQNVSFESNGSTLRVRRLGQKTWYRELFKIRYFSQILLRHFLLKLYSVDISSNDKMKLAFEKHGECFSILHIAKLIVPNASRCN